MSAVVVVDSGVANIGSVVAALERAQAQVTVSRDWDVIRRAARVLLPGVGSAAAAMRELDRLGLSERLPTLTQPVLGVCLGMQLMFEGSEEGGEHRDPGPAPQEHRDPGPGTRDPVGAANRDQSAFARQEEASGELRHSDCAGSPGSRVPGPGSRLHPCPESRNAAIRCLAILPGRVCRLPETPGVRIPHMGWNALIPRRAHPLVAGLGERDYAYFVHSFAVAESELAVMACRHGSTFTAIAARGNFMGAQFHPERSAAVGARLLGNFLKLDLELLP